jgi:hypothetical protein
MINGRPPFMADNANQVFTLVLEQEPYFSDNFDPIAKDLI